MRSNANISYKIHFFFGETVLVALDTYAKKITHPRPFFLGGGGVHGKSCWLIAYYTYVVGLFSTSLLTFAGGSGVFSIQICRSHPTLSVTMMEMPNVVDCVKEHFLPEDVKANLNLVPGWS